MKVDCASSHRPRLFIRLEPAAEDAKTFSVKIIMITIQGPAAVTRGGEYRSIQ
jgi:hypothetical protein